MHSVRGRQVRHSICCDSMQAMPSPFHVAARGKHALGLPMQCRLLWSSSTAFWFLTTSVRLTHTSKFCTGTPQRNNKHAAKVCENIFAWADKLHGRLCRMCSRLFQRFHWRSSMHWMPCQHMLEFFCGPHLVGLHRMHTAF